jgi:hypothetical protein
MKWNLLATSLAVEVSVAAPYLANPACAELNTGNRPEVWPRWM